MTNLLFFILLISHFHSVPFCFMVWDSIFLSILFSWVILSSVFTVVHNSWGQNTWHLQAAPPVRDETVFGLFSLLLVAPPGGAMCFVPSCIFNFIEIFPTSSWILSFFVFHTAWRHSKQLFHYGVSFGTKWRGRGDGCCRSRASIVEYWCHWSTCQVWETSFSFFSLLGCGVWMSLVRWLLWWGLILCAPFPFVVRCATNFLSIYRKLKDSTRYSAKNCRGCSGACDDWWWSVESERSGEIVRFSLPKRH